MTRSPEERPIVPPHVGSERYYPKTGVTILTIKNPVHNPISQDNGSDTQQEVPETEIPSHVPSPRFYPRTREIKMPKPETDSTQQAITIFG